MSMTARRGAGIGRAIANLLVEEGCDIGTCARTAAQVEEAVAGLKRELESLAGGTTQRIECDSENIEQGLAKLVLSLIELLRRLLERQAIRRMEGGSLSDQQVEEMGQALMKLEQEGYIASKWGASENNRRARCYKLTPAGSKQLAAEISEFEKVMRAITRVIQPA